MDNQQENVTIETVSDDFDISQEAMERVQHTESIVRSVLKLFEIDYDALIRMDEKSPYALAVAHNPAVLEHVKVSPEPVLEALKIAVAYKPYVSFSEKYGSTPDEVKQAIRAEMEAEFKQKGAPKMAKVTDVSTPFSQNTVAGAKPAIQNNSLNDIFKRT